MIFKNNLTATLVVGNFRFAPEAVITIDDNIYNIFKQDFDKAIENGFLSMVTSEDNITIFNDKNLIITEFDNDEYDKLFSMHWKVFEREIEKISDINVISELEKYAIENNKGNVYKKILYNKKIILQQVDGDG